MTEELIALLDGRETGRVVRDNRGKLTFIYSEQWRNAGGAYPLSLSMPVTLAEHPNAKIGPGDFYQITKSSSAFGRANSMSPRETPSA